ncbi:MAG TPA: DAK2 domain-containing protein [Paludibacteraceae bacterium]|nr:DAK2 domain-containing protein [Paludibacteraceae bacterium]HOL29873.1 DAK2 domain-containing protein [Paludibacteraceae bacterium]HON02775.1 DAK2 domain-containing protein [Paludibacteraceae bacterium]HPD59792.1 DAK2 domain-containing protein [Paludibacteraceae bacterium]HPQ13119.1 DAK2 domain-containing protein [Paludibacteraceae bacterium]
MNTTDTNLVETTEVSFNVESINEIIENIHRYLNKHKEYINSLNVFPVPDGDTGLNMVLTIQGAIVQMKNNGRTEKNSGEYLKDFAEQMLLNSRGCSGVILSLFAQGFTQITANNDFSKENIYRAIENGYRNAYEGTENPREGTMLTIMRALKEKYAQLMEKEENPLVIIQQTIPYLKEVLDQTPEMLPVLKKAGVVDSGGAGFIILLEGIDKELSQLAVNGISLSSLLRIGRTTRKLLRKRLSELRKSPFAPLILNIDFSRIQNSRLVETLQSARNLLGNIHLNHNNGKTLNREKLIDELQEIDDSWNPEIKNKYCTEFVLESDVITSKDQLKEKIAHYGDSLIIINSNNKYKVHIHTNKPNDLFDDVSKFGSLLFTKVDDMKKQHRNFLSEDVLDYERDKSVFCIVSGKGFADILKNLGADDILCYGKNKPSVNQLVKGLNNLKAKNIIAASDDSDILMALKYAASLCKSNVYIVESDNPISLVSMLMNISKDYDINTIFDEAMNSIHNIPFCGIARSSRNVTTENGAPVNKNDYFTVYKKKIILANKNLDELLFDTVRQLSTEGSLITLYKGADMKKENSFIERLRSKFPDRDFEEYFGGQYKYSYYITFE